MFTKGLIGLGIALTANAAAAQTQNSTTNCYSMGYSVQCNTTTTTTPVVPPPDLNAWNQQNQQNMNQSFQNLGAALAANRERRRQRKEAEAAQAQEAAQLAAQKARMETIATAVRTALERDNAPTPPPPSEKPVLLSCPLKNFTTNLALYETAARVDVTEGGVTKARAATFTPDAVTWQGPLWRSSVSRIDMKLVSVSTLPEVAGVQMTATCSLAERKF